jgi:hypothetical protein
LGFKASKESSHTIKELAFCAITGGGGVFQAKLATNVEFESLGGT